MAEKMPTAAMARLLRRMSEGDIPTDGNPKTRSWHFYWADGECCSRETVFACARRGWVAYWTSRETELYPKYSVSLSDHGRKALKRYQSKKGE